MSVGDRILEKMATKLKAAGQTSRQDLAIIDFEPIEDGKRLGHVLIAFSPEVGCPDARAVEAFFLETFGNQVRAALTTARVYDEHNAMSVVAGTLSQTRPISDAANKEAMTMVNALAYADNATNAIWNVEQDETGRKYMVRHSDENLAEIIELRKQRGQRNGPKLASLGEARVACTQGDHIKYYDNGIVAHGQVSAVSDSHVTVNGVKIDKGAVLEVTQKAPAAMSDEKAMLKDYFEQAYGDANFAQELTHTTVKEQNDGKVNQYG